MRKPTPEEFEVKDGQVTHRPTEACFTPIPGKKAQGVWSEGSLGRDGCDYDTEVVKRCMRKLWAEHLAKRSHGLLSH